MNTFETIVTRRSTRKYKDKMVEEELLDKILEAGRYAPSGGNNQTTHFIVISNKKVLEELAGLVKSEFAKMEITPGMYKSMAGSIRASQNGNYVFHFHAPVLVITANRKDYGNNIADCACALENMMIMSNSLDLGSCWINQLKWLNDNETVNTYLRKLGLAENEIVCGGLVIGYPDTESGAPIREPLQRTGNVVTYVK